MSVHSSSYTLNNEIKHLLLLLGVLGSFFRFLLLSGSDTDQSSVGVSNSKCLVNGTLGVFSSDGSGAGLLGSGNASHANAITGGNLSFVFTQTLNVSVESSSASVSSSVIDRYTHAGGLLGADTGLLQFSKS